MSVYRLEFTEHRLPKSVNQLGSCHWRVRHAETKMWDKIIFSQVANHGKPLKPLTKAKLTLTRMSSMEPDTDNLINSFKSLVDALVSCGVISDDKPSVIGIPAYLWEKVPPRKGGVRIVVEEIC